MKIIDHTDTIQCLTFQMDRDVFALELTKIREILDTTTMTRVPRIPDFMCGVMKLSGRAVPIVDLRYKLGMGRTEKTQETRIVILEVALEDKTTVIGSLVDSVQQVAELVPGPIKSPPGIESQLEAQYIKGIATRGERFIMILDIDKIFSLEELTNLKNRVPQFSHCFETKSP